MSSSQQVAAPARPRVRPAAGRSQVLLLVGAFMALLDTTIVNVALPSVRSGTRGSDPNVVVSTA